MALRIYYSDRIEELAKELKKRLLEERVEGLHRHVELGLKLHRVFRSREV